MRQPTSVNPDQRFTRSRPCPICGGYDAVPRGQGARCSGFLSDDGAWCYCTREQYAGQIEPNEKTNPPSWAHRMHGECRCGVTHAPARVRPAAGKRTMVATYSYLDVSSHLAHQTIRYDPKEFKQRRPRVPNPNPRDGGDWEWSLNGCKRYLYRLPELLAADPAEFVFVLEGERDVDRAISDLRIVGTTNPMGAGKWREEYNEYLRGRHVVIVPDNDEEGDKHVQQVAQSLHGIAASMRVLSLPGIAAHGDLSDWVDAGGTKQELLDLVQRTPPWSPAESANGTKQPRRLKRANLSTVEARAVRWLWPQRIPRGKLTLVDGDPGLGKSLMAIAIASCLSVGGTLPGMAEALPIGKTFYLAGEDDLHDTVRPRFDSMGADVSKIEVIEAVMIGDEETGLYLDPEGLPLLRGAIEEERPDLVIIDPMVSFMGGRVDMHRANEVRAMLDPLRRMAQELECAIVLIRHFRKMTEGPAIHRGAGSIDFIATCRSALVVTRHPQDEQLRVVAQGKTNLAGIAPSLLFSTKGGVFAWEGTCDLTADQLTAPRPVGRPPTKIEGAMDWLLQNHDAEPRPRDDVMQEACVAGHGVSTMERAFRDLGGISEAVRDPHGHITHRVWHPFVKGSQDPAALKGHNFDESVKSAPESRVTTDKTPIRQNSLSLGETSRCNVPTEDEREYSLDVEEGCSACGGQDPLCWLCRPLAAPADVRPDGRDGHPEGTRPVSEACADCCRVPCGCSEEGEL